MTLWGGDGRTWTDKDRLLVQALYLYELSLCPCGCGQLAKESQNPKFEGWFVAQQTVCYARKALDQMEQDKTKPREHGELRWVIRDLPWGQQPP